MIKSIIFVKFRRGGMKRFSGLTPFHVVCSEVIIIDMIEG
jgi:hypothetical protein